MKNKDHIGKIVTLAILAAWFVLIVSHIGEPVRPTEPGEKYTPQYILAWAFLFLPPAFAAYAWGYEDGKHARKE